MTLVLASLTVLAAGALLSLVVRPVRLALGISMTAVFAASFLALFAALPVLINDDSQEVVRVQWPLPLGAVSFSLDGLSAWFLMTIAILSVCVAPYTTAYMRGHAEKKLPRFGAVFCALIASLFVLVCAADAVLFLVAWETMTLSAFFLVSFDHERGDVRRGAWMYLIATHLGTALCVLPLFAYVCTAAGDTAFSAFPAALQSRAPAVLALLFGLAVFGFGTKAGFLPMHVWLPAAHPVAPTPVSALLSGVVVKSGIYGLLRLLLWLPPLPAICGQALLVLGIVSGVMGVLYALAQHDLKRLLAYHTVENIGIIAIGIAVGMLGQTANHPVVSALGYAGALLHVTNHAIFKGLLFLSAGAVLHSAGTMEIERLGGLARKTPVNAAMFLVGAVAICGLPPLNGFVSEWVIYMAMFNGAMSSAAFPMATLALGILSLALMGGLALACFAKVFGVVFLGEPRDAGIEPHQTPWPMKAGMAVLAAACFIIGIAPALWAVQVRSAAIALSQMPSLQVGLALDAPLTNGLRFTVVALALIGIFSLLLILRRLMQRGTPPVQGVPTWGCGYAYPTARMQYSASSFATPLLSSFRSVLWPAREFVAPAGPFPSKSHLHVHTPDTAEQDLFQPVFRGISRVFAMIRTVSWRASAQTVMVSPPSLRHAGPLSFMFSGMIAALRRGSIHTCLLLVVITLVLVFLIESVVTSDLSRVTETLRAAEDAGNGMR